MSFVLVIGDGLVRCVIGVLGDSLVGMFWFCSLVWWNCLVWFCKVLVCFFLLVGSWCSCWVSWVGFCGNCVWGCWWICVDCCVMIVDSVDCSWFGWLVVGLGWLCCVLLDFWWLVVGWIVLFVGCVVFVFGMGGSCRCCCRWWGCVVNLLCCCCWLLVVCVVLVLLLFYCCCCWWFVLDCRYCGWCWIVGCRFVSWVWILVCWFCWWWLYCCFLFVWWWWCCVLVFVWWIVVNLGW